MTMLTVSLEIAGQLVQARLSPTSISRVADGLVLWVQLDEPEPVLQQLLDGYLGRRIRLALVEVADA